MIFRLFNAIVEWVVLVVVFALYCLMAQHIVPQGVMLMIMVMWCVLLLVYIPLRVPSSIGGPRMRYHLGVPGAETSRAAANRVHPSGWSFGAAVR
jgi:hypothetical protein